MFDPSFLEICRESERIFGKQDGLKQVFSSMEERENIVRRQTFILKEKV